MTSSKLEFELDASFDDSDDNRASKERSHELSFQESPKEGQYLKTIRIWINAFIPRDLPKLTKVVPAGQYVGQTMVSCNHGLRSFSYLTDQRDFSNNITAAARSHSELTLDFQSDEVSMIQKHWCSKTIEVNKRNGKERATQSGKVNGRFRIVQLTNPIRISFDCSASAPLWRGDPEIDYQGDITVNVLQKRISYSGKVDGFPAFEMYAQINGEHIKKVFTIMPPIDGSPKDMWGKASRAITRHLTFD